MDITSFREANLSPVSIDKNEDIIRLFYKQGFAIIDGNSLPKEKPLTHLSACFHLGDVFISDYNKVHFPNKLNANNTTYIGFHEGTRDKIKHDVFEGNAYLEQHTDGAMSPLAEVKTTVLFCDTPAQSGGNTLLFNAYGAIKYLESRYADFSLPLKSQKALRRMTTFEGIHQERIDCVLGMDSVYKREAIRLTFDQTGDWQYGFERVPGLRNSFDKLYTLYKMDSLFTLEFPLNKGDAIIIDNTRLTHGRTAFTSYPNSPRTIVRTLHTRLPSLS